MKINGLMNDDEILWKKMSCKCNHDSVETEFPIAECLHCQFQAQEDSMPREDFVIKENDIDDDGNSLETTHDKTINEITITRGNKYQEIIGWSF
tara:strand:- start:1032 stop:1313 length:282 start_codon:yes stop_codon:yes gene_type:complete